MLKRLKLLIKESGLSQNKFAAEIGSSGSVLCGILSGKRRLGNGMLARIVARFNVNEHWLRTGEGEMFATEPPPVERFVGVTSTETTAQRIRYLRKYLGLSQIEFARKLNRKQGVIANWETGTRNLPDFAYFALTQVFGVNRSWLETGKGEMFAATKAPPSVERSERDDFKRVALKFIRELPEEKQALIREVAALILDVAAEALKQETINRDDG